MRKIHDWKRTGNIVANQYIRQVDDLPVLDPVQHRRRIAPPIKSGQEFPGKQLLETQLQIETSYTMIDRSGRPQKTKEMRIEFRIIPLLARDRLHARTKPVVVRVSGNFRVGFSRGTQQMKWKFLHK